MWFGFTCYILKEKIILITISSVRSYFENSNIKKFDSQGISNEIPKTEGFQRPSSKNSELI